MAVNSVLPPYPVYFDASGKPLEGGYIYIGQPGFEARTTPKASFFDVAQTIPTGTASGAAIRTSGGYPLRNGTPAMFYAEEDFSITVTDRNGVVLYSSLNRTLALNIGGTIGPVLAPDGNLAATGFGFTSETNTGFVRSGTGTVQNVIQGAVVSQQTAGGTTFLQPVSGAGFVSGVTAALGPDLTALEALAGTGIAVRTAADTWAQRTIVSGSPSVSVTNGDGVAGNPSISFAGPVQGALTSTASGGPYSANIPSGIRRLEFIYDRISLDSGGNWFAQIGPSSGVVTTGYESASSTRGGGVGPATNGMVILSGAANRQITGRMIFTLMDSATNLWISEHNGGTTSTDTAPNGGGRVALAGPLERFRLTFTAANNPNNGQFRLQWE